MDVSILLVIQEAGALNVNSTQRAVSCNQAKENILFLVCNLSFLFPTQVYFKAKSKYSPALLKYR